MEAEKERKGDSDYIQITSWPIQLFDKQIKHLYPPPDLSLAHLILSLAQYINSYAYSILLLAYRMIISA